MISQNCLKTNILQEFVDGIPYAAILCSFDYNESKILTTNKLHEKLTGYSTSELFGKSPRIFKGNCTEESVSNYIKSQLELCHFASVNVLNQTKTKIPHKITLIICGVVIDKKNYYVAIKQPVQ